MDYIIMVSYKTQVFVELQLLIVTWSIMSFALYTLYVTILGKNDWLTRNSIIMYARY